MKFGLSLGLTGSGAADNCFDLPEGEIFFNRHFDCGIDYWHTIEGDVTSNSPSHATFTTSTENGMLTQVAQFPIPAGSYHLGLVVTEIVGNGKMSYILADGTDVTAVQFNSAGTYEADITVDQEITAVYVGADNDSTFVATFDGISCMDSSIAHYPDWWKIATLNETDILGAWDFLWGGVNNTETAKTTLAGTMPSFENAIGGPVWREGLGVSFGGGGAYKSPFPDGIDYNNITVLIQCSGMLQNATLDAFYSIYKSRAHYTLQNGWGSGKIRWSCGNGDSTTIEVGSAVRNGIVVTSGRTLYVDGSNLGEVPESGEALSNGDDFILGAIQLDNGRIVQPIRGYLQKVLIVKKLLTEDEINEIISNINGTTQVLDMDRDGKPDTLVMTNGKYTVSEDEDSINIDVDGDGIADAVIPK